jgi:hypothetical protein
LCQEREEKKQKIGRRTEENEGIQQDEHEKAEHLKRKGRKWRRCIWSKEREKKVCRKMTR